jgi:hypothetical protein
MPRSIASGEFRVEEFRVPLVDARLSGPKGVQVAPRELPLNVQLNYLSGGAMTGAPARVSALLPQPSAHLPGARGVLVRAAARRDESRRARRAGRLCPRRPIPAMRSSSPTSCRSRPTPMARRPSR